MRRGTRISKNIFFTHEGAIQTHLYNTCGIGMAMAMEKLIVENGRTFPERMKVGVVGYSREWKKYEYGEVRVSGCARVWEVREWGSMRIWEV